MAAHDAGPLAVGLALGNTTSGCPDTQYPWAYNYLGECVHNDKQLAALILGLSSILFWMVAQAPQIYKNYRKGSADGLSGYFLLDWLCGDVTNLVGCLLTKQVPTQLYTAIWFCFIDCAMLSQFVYYTKYAKRKAKTLKSYSVAAFLMTVAVGTVISAQMAPAAELEPPHHTGRTLLTVQSFSSSKAIAGYAIGWVSGLLYCTSRIPQIIKNFRRKSTEGLSLAMFMMAILGNCTYALGVLLISVKNDFIIDHLPWLVGSIGTLVFDFTIFFQFVCYGAKDEDEDAGIKPSLETDPLLQAV